DRAFVVETFDRAPWREESDLEWETLVLCASVNPLDHVVVPARLGLDRGPASIEQDPDGGAATRRRERGFQERVRDVTPQLVEVERIDRESLLRGGEQTEDSLGVERRIRGTDDWRRAGLGGGAG